MTLPIFALCRLIRRYRWIGCCLLLTLPLQSLSQSTDEEPSESAPPASPTKATSTKPAPTASFSREMLLQLFEAERAFAAGDYETAFKTYWNYAQSLKSPQFAKRAAEILVIRQSKTGGSSVAEYGRIRPVVDYWFDLDKTSMMAFEWMLELHLITGDTASIAPILKKALAKHPELAASYWEVIRDSFRKTPPMAVKQRLALVTQWAALSPKQAEAKMALAEMALRADQRTAAINSAKAAARLKPNWDEPVIMQAEMLLSDRKVDEAKALLTQFLKRNPDATRIKSLLGEVDLLTGDDKSAFDIYRQLADAHPEEVELSIKAAQLAEKNKNYDAATAYLNQALLYEDDAIRKDQILLELVQIALIKDKFDEPPLLIEKISNDKDKLTAQIGYVIALTAAKRVDEATAYLLEAYRNADERTRPAYAYAASAFFRETGQPAQLRSFLTEALATAPDDPALLYNSAMLAEQDGDYQLSEKQLRRIIELQPTNAHAYNALGYSFVDRNTRLDEARPLLEKAIALAPDDPMIQDSVGWLEFRSGNPEKAIEWLTKAYEKTKEPEIAAHLGEVYWTMGNQDKALEIWKTALKSESPHPVLQKTIDRLYGRPL